MLASLWQLANCRFCFASRFFSAAEETQKQNRQNAWNQPASYCGTMKLTWYCEANMKHANNMLASTRRPTYELYPDKTNIDYFFIIMITIVHRLFGGLICREHLKIQQYEIWCPAPLSATASHDRQPVHIHTEK